MQAEFKIPKLCITMINGDKIKYASETNLADFIAYLCEGEAHMLIINLDNAPSVAVNLNHIIRIDEILDEEHYII